MIYLLAYYKSRIGNLEESMEVARVMIVTTRNEFGRLLYDLNLSMTDLRSMIFVDVWETREALAAHFETPHMAVWRKSSDGYFIERRIETVHPRRVEQLQ